MAHQPTSSRDRLIADLKAKATDPEIAALLSQFNGGIISIQDGAIKTIKQANAVGELAMFDPTDEKRDGIYTLSKGVLDRGNAFIVTHIGLRAYQAITYVNGNPAPATLNPRTTEEYAAMLAADSLQCINAIPALANGDCALRINRKPIFEKLSNQVFVNTTEASTDQNVQSVGRVGVYRLDNPVLIKPQVPIEFSLRFPVATPGSTIVETIFYGASTLPA